ncbi:MAG TPA: TraB/GumN family protein [Kofleriaceae bacterium]|nr:TraB/GumN family protein [Kofleriaceae bacterium]
MRIPLWRRVIALLSVGWLVGPGAACKDGKSDDVDRQSAPAASAPADPAARTTAEPRPATESEHQAIFFEVTSAGGSKSWILGTMHMGFDYQELPAAIWSRLGDAGTVVFEADTRTMEEVVRDRAVLPEGQSLEALLGPQTWARLQAELPQIPADGLRRMPPWLVSSILLSRLFPTALPLDMAVLREAERARKSLIFLEDMAWQADLLAEEMGPEAVVSLLDDASPMRRSLADGAAAYQRGDFEALSRITLDPASLGGDEAQLERMIFSRNARWHTLLAEPLARGRVFVAVGAAHLAGDKGLLAMLERDGFTVARVAR